MWKEEGEGGSYRDKKEEGKKEREHGVVGPEKDKPPS
jgi:hypothetical protein